MAIVKKQWKNTSEPYTCGLKRTQSDISEEFSDSTGSEVDKGTVGRGIFNSDEVNEGLLEEFVTSKLESTLKEVTSSSRTEASQKSASTLSLDDLAETTNHTLVVDFRRKLNTGFNDIDWGHSTVSDGAADGTSEGETSVKVCSSRRSRVSSRGSSDKVLLKGSLRWEHFNWK